jgi:ABC-type amino acid transport substrate-binding protein
LLSGLGLEYSIEEYGLDEMLASIAQGRADVGISCLSKTHEREKISVLPFEFEKQSYAFALPDHSPHVEKFNQALLFVLESPLWRKELVKYLGK